MAKAPRPGSTRTAAAAEETAGVQEMVITVRGETVRLLMSMLGPRDDALVRRQTLKALGYKASLLGAINELNSDDTVGLDSVALLWWLARRKAGEDELSLNEALDEFPSYGDMESDPDVIGLDVVEPGEDDEGDASPEPSGAASAPRGRTSRASSASSRGRSAS